MKVIIPIKTDCLDKQAHKKKTINLLLPNIFRLYDQTWIDTGYLKRNYRAMMVRNESVNDAEKKSYPPE